MTGVYKIQSLIKPDRIYIGSAGNVSNRWANHRCSLRNQKHHSKKLQRHYNKYGSEDLIYDIICICEKSDLLFIEQSFIDSLKPYFNTCLIAGRTTGILTWLGKHHTEETKQKLRKPKSEEHKQKLRVPHSLEHNAKMGKAHSKKVINIKTNEIFDAIKIAAKNIGISERSLYKQLSGELKNRTDFILLEKYKKDEGSNIEKV